MATPAAAESLPPPAPSQRDATRRRRGTVTITGQRLRVGRTYAGHTVAIAMEDTVFRVQHNDVVLVTHAR